MIRGLPDRLRARQATFDETGGLHGAAIFARDGALLASAEDVGRHNAVDKSIGALLLEEGATPARPACSWSAAGCRSRSCRRHGWRSIPVVAAISAPTSLAIELAREAGITLLGFVREKSLNIYTHESRIAGV